MLSSRPAGAEPGGGNSQLDLALTKSTPPPLPEKRARERKKTPKLEQHGLAITSARACQLFGICLQGSHHTDLVLADFTGCQESKRNEEVIHQKALCDTKVKSLTNQSVHSELKPVFQSYVRDSLFIQGHRLIGLDLQF